VEYIGEISLPDVRKAVENSDCVLSIGALLSDFNTGSFSYHIGKNRTIELHSTWTQVRYATYPGIGMKKMLRKFIDRVDVSKVSHPVRAEDVVSTNKGLLATQKDSSSIITHEWLWPTMGTFFKPKDVIVTETGTSNFGILDSKFPEDVIAISQVLWGSIGYSVGAVLGAALAARELPDGAERRVILFVGEGSLQLTVQEISTIIRRGLKPILFVINNKGYAIEKLIHGRDKEYNNIADWKYGKLLEVFGAKNPRSFRVETKDELTKLLSEKEFSDPKDIQLVELMMGEFDAPRSLKLQAEMTAKSNRS